MNNTKYLLLISACFVLSSNTQANEVNLTFSYSGTSLGNTALHTLHTPIELKPTPFLNNSGIKLAAVRSITDAAGISFGNNDNSYGLDTSKQCAEIGYNITSCPEHSSPKSACPFDANVFKECACDTSYYTVTDANKTATCGYFNSGEVCSDSTGTYHACRCNPTIDNLTYCAAENEYISEADYRKNITEGYNWCRDDRDLEMYYYPKSICQTCLEPYVRNSSKTGCVCSTEYKECDLGYEAGAQSCVENGVTKYNKCKSCPNLGTLSSCPNGYTCKLEDCSNKFYITGCAVNNVDMEQCSWYSCWINPLPKN